MIKTEQQLKHEIVAELEKWELQLAECEMPAYRRDFHINQIHWMVKQLLYIGSTIRQYQAIDTEEWWHKGGRSCIGLLDQLVVAGQSLTSTLFSCNLRDKITDKIENFYGINFSGLYIARRYKNTNDGTEVYVWTRMHDMKPQESVSFVKDCVNTWLPYGEFIKQYSATK
jgi:hypothetical protein